MRRVRMMGHFCPKFRIKMFNAIRTQGMTEIHHPPMTEVFFNGVPITFIIPDLFA
jgi:hypothetical protein